MSIQKSLDFLLQKNSYEWRAEWRIEYCSPVNPTARHESLVVQVTMKIGSLGRRAVNPQMKIGSVSAFETKIDKPSSEVVGLFGAVPNGGDVEFWVGDEAIYRSPYPFRPEAIERIDPRSIDLDRDPPFDEDDSLWNTLKKQLQEAQRGDSPL